MNMPIVIVVIIKIFLSGEKKLQVLTLGLSPPC